MTRVKVIWVRGGGGYFMGGKRAKSMHFKKTQNVTERFLGFVEVCLLLTENLYGSNVFSTKNKENAKCQPIRQTSYFYVDIKYLRPSRNFKELKIHRL